MRRMKSFEKNKFYSTPPKRGHLLNRMPEKGTCPCSFLKESDGLRQGKAEESKGEEKPWFVLSFCTPHNGLCKLKDVNAAH